MLSPNFMLIQTLMRLTLAQQQFFCSNENTSQSTPMENMYQSSLLCSEYCLKQHYKYAIIQQFTCWCSDISPANTVNNGKCDTVCPGYGLQNCGGVNNGAFGYFYLGESTESDRPLDLYSQSEVSSISEFSKYDTTTTSETLTSSEHSSTSDTHTMYSEQATSSGSSIILSTSSSSTPSSSSSYETPTKQSTLSSQRQTLALKSSSIPPSSSKQSTTTTQPKTLPLSLSLSHSHSPVTTTSIRLTTSIVYSVLTFTKTYSYHSNNITSHNVSSTASHPVTIQYITTDIISTQYTQEPITTWDHNLSNKRPNSNADSFWHSSGKVAGVFIGVGGFLAAAVFGLVFWYCKNRVKSDMEDDSERDVYVYGDSKDDERKVSDGEDMNMNLYLNGGERGEYYSRGRYSSNGIMFPSDVQSMGPSLSDDELGDYVLVDQRLDPGQMLTELGQVGSNVSLADDVDYTRRVLSVVNG